jgi:DNA polymerase-3 subunit alpha
MVTIGAMVSKVRRKATKNDQTMAFVEIEDMYGSVNVIVFPKLFEQYAETLKQGVVIKVLGRVSCKESGEVDIIADRIETLVKGKAVVNTNVSQSENTTKQESSKYKKGLYLRVTSMSSAEYIKARELLDNSKGDIPVIIKETESNKAYCSPQNSWVSVDKMLLSNLCDILGQENVKFIE